MGGTVWPQRVGLTGRHPVIAFLLGIAALSAFMQLVWANMAGGWIDWGSAILWYRMSCTLQDVLLALGAYYGARKVAGPLWWRFRYYPAWTWFIFILAGGALFLMVLSRRLAELYVGEGPPMTTGWLPVWHRTWLPFLFLLWLRRRWFSAPVEWR